LSATAFPVDPSPHPEKATTKNVKTAHVDAPAKQANAKKGRLLKTTIARLTKIKQIPTKVEVGAIIVVWCLLIAY